MKPTRLFEFISYQNDNAPLEKSFTTKYNGKWESISSQTFCDQAEAISNALIELGIQSQDKITMISSNNRTEWSLMDVGLLTIGAVNVPIYPTISSKDYEYILATARLLPNYCFPVGLNVVDKFAKIPNWMSKASRRYYATHLLKQAVKSKDQNTISLAVKILSKKVRSWRNRPLGGMAR